jgi:2,4-dienoyl-CoA reductase-like NADH-dependent reductase (Old Yellow Enzyme family)
MRESNAGAVPPPGDREGYYGPEGILFRRNLSIPVILTGGFLSRSAMDGALGRGEADLIGLSRALIREPDLPALMQSGKERADCDACSECLRFSRMKSVACTKDKD